MSKCREAWLRERKRLTYLMAKKGGTVGMFIQCERQHINRFLHRWQTIFLIPKSNEDILERREVLHVDVQFTIGDVRRSSTEEKEFKLGHRSSWKHRWPCLKSIEYTLFQARECIIVNDETCRMSVLGSGGCYVEIPKSRQFPKDLNVDLWPHSIHFYIQAREDGER